MISLPISKDRAIFLVHYWFWSLNFSSDTKFKVDVVHVWIVVFSVESGPTYIYGFFWMDAIVIIEVWRSTITIHLF